MEAGLLVGAVGDISLQLAEKLGVGNDGLRPYFKKQGPVLSVVKAAALTGFWSWVYFSADPTPSPLRFALFAGVLDEIYREFYPTLYPTLDTYYQGNSREVTVAANAFTALLVWWAKKNLIPGV